MYRLNTKHWHILRINFLLAGIITLGSVLLATFIHPLWMIPAGFIGCMQLIFALTGYCPSSMVLARMGVPQS